MITRIVVAGLGKLGAPIASVFANAGFAVTGLDLDPKKVEAINAGHAPIREPWLEDLVAHTRANGKLRATTNAVEAVRDSGVCIFITPTPSLPDGSFDNGQLLTAIETVAKAIPETLDPELQDPYLFIVASTVNPGTCDNVILPLLTKLLVRPFHLVYKPEFIALGSVIHDLEHPDFHLFGESSPEAGDMATPLYDEISCAPFKRMSLVEAELAKISLNSFVTMKISFANQVGMVAEKLGADPHKILDAIGTDHRIGAAALRPGLPFGGPCFPRDSRMFMQVASSVGVYASLAYGTDAINDRVIYSIAIKAHSYKGDIGILGMAYKPGTSITEESPGIRIKELLQTRIVKTHDPMAEHSHSLEEVLACPILIVATPWPEYKALPFPAETALIDPMHVIQSRIISLNRREVVNES